MEPQVALKFKKYGFLLAPLGILFFIIWFFGSPLFPLMHISDQYVGESIFVERLVSFRPAALVIYDADLYPRIEGLVGIKYVSGSVFYGNFDVFLDNPENLHPGRYIAVLYTDPGNSSEQILRFGNLIRDIFGRSQKSTFTLK